MKNINFNPAMYKVIALTACLLLLIVIQKSKAAHNSQAIVNTK